MPNLNLAIKFEFFLCFSGNDLAVFRWLTIDTVGEFVINSEDFVIVSESEGRVGVSNVLVDLGFQFEFLRGHFGSDLEIGVAQISVGLRQPSE